MFRFNVFLSLVAFLTFSAYALPAHSPKADDKKDKPQENRETAPALRTLEEKGFSKEEIKRIEELEKNVKEKAQLDAADLRLDAVRYAKGIAMDEKSAIAFSDWLSEQPKKDRAKARVLYEEFFKELRSLDFTWESAAQWSYKLATSANGVEALELFKKGFAYARRTIGLSWEQSVQFARLIALSPYKNVEELLKNHEKAFRRLRELDFAVEDSVKWSYELVSSAKGSEALEHFNKGFDYGRRTIGLSWEQSVQLARLIALSPNEKIEQLVKDHEKSFRTARGLGLSIEDSVKRANSDLELKEPSSKNTKEK
jgi:hypothetical protein